MVSLGITDTLRPACPVVDWQPTMNSIVFLEFFEGGGSHIFFLPYRYYGFQFCIFMRCLSEHAHACVSVSMCRVFPVLFLCLFVCLFCPIRVCLFLFYLLLFLHASLFSYEKNKERIWIWVVEEVGWI